MLLLLMMAGALATAMCEPEITIIDGNVHVVLEGNASIFAVQRRIDGALSDPLELVTKVERDKHAVGTMPLP